MSKDYYKILGVTEFDSAENIKLAYRKLARKWHPDVAGNTNDVMLKFKEINEAYEILSNRIKKEEYDRARSFYNYAKNNSTTQKKEEELYKQKRMNEGKEQEKFFDFKWEEFLWKNHKEKNDKYNRQEFKKSPKKGKDIFTDIEISVLEAFSGTCKTINVLQTQICDKCHGRKFVNGNKCQTCDGKGEKTNYKKFNVKIPAGIKNNSKIRLANEGAEGINGGKNGDLYIVIHVSENKEFKTEGLNILKTISIQPHEAVLGSIVKINTINGNLNVKIAPNTQNGQKIRLPGAGMVQNNKIGDMIITIEIQIPRNLSTEELELYKRLEEISTKNIRNSGDV